MRLVPRLHPRRRPRTLERLLRLPHRAARAAVPGGAAPAEDVRRRLVLRGRPGRRGRRCSRRAARSSGRRCSTASQPMPFPALQQRVRRRSTRRATSGTGAADFVERDPRRGDRSCTSSTAQKLPTWQSTCTSIRSTARPHAWARRDTPWAYRDANWAQVIVGVDPDPAERGRRSRDWTRRLLGRAASVLARAAPTSNMMMDEGQERVQAHLPATTTSAWPQIKAQVRPGQLLPRQPEHQAGVAAIWSSRGISVPRELRLSCSA